MAKPRNPYYGNRKKKPAAKDSAKTEKVIADLRAQKAEIERRREAALAKLSRGQQAKIRALELFMEAAKEVVEIELERPAFASVDGPVSYLLEGHADELAVLHDWARPVADRRERARRFLFTRVDTVAQSVDIDKAFYDRVMSLVEGAHYADSTVDEKLSKAKQLFDIAEQGEKVADAEYALSELEKGKAGNPSVLQALAESVANDDRQGSTLHGLLAARPDLQALMVDTSKTKEERADVIVPYLRELVATTDMSNTLDPFVQKLRTYVQRETGATDVEEPKKPISPEYKEEVIESARLALAWGQIEKPVLQPNDCSRLHKLIEANTAGKILGVPDVKNGDEVRVKTRRSDYDFSEAKVFVVKHDWASLFADSASDAVEDGALQLPADSCAFEFRISGRTLVVLASSVAGQTAFVPLLEAIEGIWMVYVCETTLPAFEFAIAQARACCVMLDAQVATHEVTRAPPALNVKRAKQGKPALRDFYTIDLSKRKRAAPPAGGYAESGRHKRLHFCRSHWRHFNVESMHPGRGTLQVMCPEPKCRATVGEACRQVRIPWCLKGDPELGFVDKHYRI